MILWLFLAILTATVLAAILSPLRRDISHDPAVDIDRADLAVYRDQLAEIQNDRERDLIEPQAADAARAELARRILSRTKAHPHNTTTPSADPKPGQPSPPKTAPGAAQSYLVLGLAALIPLASAGLYAALGSPNLPGRPHLSGVEKSTARTEIEKLIAKVEAQLRKMPQDGRGWDVVAPVYFRLERFDDALVSYRQAVQLLGPTTSRLKGLGLSAIRASGGVVTPEARDAFQKLLAADPSSNNARLWLARAKEQDGDIPGAIDIYQQMLANAPDSAPWQPIVKQRIAALKADQTGAAPQAPGSKQGANSPPAAVGRDGTPIAAMSDEQRARFIANMVEGLASRLKKDGSNFQDWVKLVRAYAVLGRSQDAKKALADARARFADDQPKTRELEALARQYNLGS